MSFLPNSTIYLCNVPFDGSQKNQIYFNSKSEQETYFKSKSVDLLISYQTMRKNKPDGSSISSVKIEKNIDSVYAMGVNYIMYQNANFGDKWFFAFVEKVIYINDEVTEIVFETDVFQTWFFDVEILPSYVVREHSELDDIGENTLPEKFNFNEYSYLKLLPDIELQGGHFLNEYCFLICSTICLSEYTSEGAFNGYEIAGVPQGLYYYVCLDYSDIDKITKKHADYDSGWLQSITAIPKFALKNAYISGDGTVKDPENETVISGMITTLGGSNLVKSNLAKDNVSVIFDINNSPWKGWSPKNNKLFTSPYLTLSVTNHNGVINDYAIEDFSNPINNGLKNFGFTLTADISTTPSVYLIPKNYQGMGVNIDFASVISEFPQISHNSDTYKLWLAKNQGSLALETIGNVGNIITGLVTMSSGMGAMQAMHGVTGVIDTINTVNQAKRQPNHVTGGNGKNSLLLMLKELHFEYYWKTIKLEHAKTIDDFFTMFGYSTNRIKRPNLNSRPHFNYIQTIDINIVGGIPFDDMEKFKAIFNNGVTLWKKESVIGNYNVDNSPQ